MCEQPAPTHAEIVSHPPRGLEGWAERGELKAEKRAMWYFCTSNQALRSKPKQLLFSELGYRKAGRSQFKANQKHLCQQKRQWARGRRSAAPCVFFSWLCFVSWFRPNYALLSASEDGAKINKLLWVKVRARWEQINVKSATRPVQVQGGQSPWTPESCIRALEWYF